MTQDITIAALNVIFKATIVLRLSVFLYTRAFLRPFLYAGDAVKTPLSALLISYLHHEN